VKRAQKERIIRGRRKEWRRRTRRKEGGKGKRRIPFRQYGAFSIEDCTASNDGMSNLRESGGKWS
jgi:hypothetical protein